MRLEFGNPEHIAKVKKDSANAIAENLLKTLKCPKCKAKANHCFSADIDEDSYGINFACKESCPNYPFMREDEDIDQYEEMVRCEQCISFFDQKGKPLENQDRAFECF